MSEPSAPTPEKPGLTWAQKTRLAGIILVGAAVLIIVAQNTEVVETRILFYPVRLPQAILLFLTLAVGFLFGYISGRRKRKK
jgi:uncharacterized integral membrane protein